MQRSGIAHGARVRLALVLTVALSALCLPDPAVAADSDLSSEVTGPAMVAPGGEATYTVAYGNAGPDEALSAYCDLVFPAGVPAPLAEITDDQIDAIGASAVDTAGNLQLVFATVSCDQLLIQTQGPSGGGTPMQDMGAGASHSFSIATEFPLDPVIMSAGLVIDAPPSIAGAVWNLGHGTCATCNDFSTCFGGPLSTYDLGSRPVELADDGSASPSEGCQAFTVTPGSIALVDRGTCAFGDKVANAEAGGAAGVIIANSGQCLNGPPSPDCVNDMTPGDLGLSTDVPVVQVSQNQGTAIKDALLIGPVMATLGGIPTSDAVFSSLMFLENAADTDPDPANDGTLWSTAIVDLIFDDGFESGDTGAWSSAAP